MRVINICNLKGGVGKTVTAINLAAELAAAGRKVLLIDNDKQGNTSKFFNVHSYDKPGMPEVLTGKSSITKALHTVRERLYVVPANMNLLAANKAILLDTENVQQEHLKKAFEPVNQLGLFDYCIIDNAPDADMSVINALAAGDDLIIPVKADRFTFDGVEIMLDYAAQVRDNYNPRLTFRGCLITSYRKNEVNEQGEAFLKNCQYSLFKTRIHWTPKVDESTFAGLSVREYSPHSWAARNYKALAAEYLEMIGDVSTSDKKGRK